MAPVGGQYDKPTRLGDRSGSDVGEPRMAADSLGDITHLTRDAGCREIERQHPVSIMVENAFEPSPQFFRSLQRSGTPDLGDPRVYLGDGYGGKEQFIISILEPFDRFRRERRSPRREGAENVGVSQPLRSAPRTGEDRATSQAGEAAPSTGR